MLAKILKTTLHLPRKIRAVCWITFWSWFGKYPALSLLCPSTNRFDFGRVVSVLRSVQISQLALFMIPKSLMYIVYGTTWVGETYYRQNADNAAKLQTTKDIVGEIARKGSLALVLFSLISFTSSIFLPFLVSLPRDDNAPRPILNTPRRFRRTASLFQRYQIDITTAWGISQLVFAASMILAPFSTSFQFATTLIALCGA